MLNRYLYLPLKLPQIGPHLMQAYRDPLRKPMKQLLSDLVLYSVKTKDPAQYFYSFLYRRGIEDPLLYLSHHQYRKLRALVTRPETAPQLANKLLFQRTMEEAGIPVPAYLGHIEAGVFHDADGATIQISGPHDLDAIAAKLLEGGRESFFAKQLNHFGGKGAFRVTRPSDLSSQFAALQSTPYLFQETVQQHSDFAAVHPASLNTMRIVTCTMRNDEPRIVSGYMRFGIKGAVVDNSSSGGFMAGIDLGSGRLATPGIHPFRKGGEICERHPDSGIPMVGFQIPMFDQVLELVERAAATLRYPLVGWDVAVTPSGPLIVEGNDKPDYFDDEITDRPYKSHPVMRRFIEELTGGCWL